MLANINLVPSPGEEPIFTITFTTSSIQLDCRKDTTPPRTILCTISLSQSAKAALLAALQEPAP